MIRKSIIIGMAALIGAAGGYAYYHFVACNNGSCILGASPLVSLVLGAVWAGAVGSVIAEMGGGNADI
jgi:hypothetical protein